MILILLLLRCKISSYEPRNGNRIRIRRYYYRGSILHKKRESLLIYLYLSWTISLNQRINRRRLHLEDNHSMMTSSVRNNSHRVIQSSPVLFSSSSSGLDFSKTRARTRWIVFSHKHTHKYKYMHINHL